MDDLLDHPVFWSQVVSRLTGNDTHDAIIIASLCDELNISREAVLAKMKTYCRPGSDNPSVN